MFCVDVNCFMVVRVEFLKECFKIIHVKAVKIRFVRLVRFESLELLPIQNFSVFDITIKFIKEVIFRGFYKIFVIFLNFVVIFTEKVTRRKI